MSFLPTATDQSCDPRCPSCKRFLPDINRTSNNRITGFAVKTSIQFVLSEMILDMSSNAQTEWIGVMGGDEMKSGVAVDQQANCHH